METRSQAKNFPFLQGGGEMGDIIREFDWSQTSIGTPDQWPQALQISLTNLLNSGFPMFLFWGSDLVCFYNDAYRPSLGENGKHPAIGKKGKEVWADIWDFIGPLIKDVLETGKAAWFKDQLVPFYRNGRVEDIYWTFSYSLIVSDNGQPGGVLVTCIETTEAVLGRKKLEESKSRLQFALTAAHLGSWELDLKTFELEASAICKQIFGQPSDQPFSYDSLRNTIHPDDRQRQEEAVIHTINTGADYDIEYRIIRPDASVHWVNVRGQVQYDHNNLPENMAGVSLDITDRKEAELKLQESESRFRDILEQAPVAIGLTRGEDFVFESINSPMLQLIHRKHKQDVIGKPLIDVLPELVGQPVFTIFQNVLETGESFSGTEIEVELAIEGILQRRYFNLTYSRVVDKDGAPSVLHMAADVTQQVLARRKTEESEAKLRSILNSAPAAMVVFAGPDLIIENPNQLMIELMGAGQDIEGRSFRTVLNGVVEEDQKFIQLIDTVRTTGNPFEAPEVEVLFKAEKKKRYFNINFIPLYDESGAVYAVLDVSVDVTGQVATRRRLLQIESRFRDTVMQAPVAIAIFRGPAHIVEVANEEQLRLWGRTAEQVIERPFSEALPEMAGQGFEELLAKVLTTGEPFYAKELPANLLRGGKLERVYLNFVYEALREDDGSISRVIVVATEVTETVIAAQKLAASEAKFRSLIEEAPFATAFYTGPELTIDIVNEAMLQLWDKPASVVGKTFEQALPELEGQPFTGLLKEVYRTGVEYTAKGQPADIIRNGRLQRGWYNFNYKPTRNEDGHVYGIVHMAVEVTEQVLAIQKLEENEAALATALEQVRLSKEAAELGTFDMDLKKGTMHWDDRCRTLFGISHHQPVTYERDFLQGLHPDDRQRILAIIDKAFIKAQSDGEYDVEYRTIGAEDRVERWVKAKGKVYFDDKETPVRFIGSVLDITAQMTAIQKIEKTVEERTKELALANESLQAINKELQRSNQNLEEFAHAASHDLKEPIRKIHFFTHQLREQLSSRLKDNENRSFSRIENATERMGNLIDDLLLYSHVSQRPHETESVDLNEKVQRVMEDLELDIDEKKAVIHVEKLPVVQGYRRQIQQLFQNLISNALKYSKEDVPPQINITARVVREKEQEYNVISVSDNGIGFEQQYADKIFQMFSRLHGKAEYSGTGVGLSIVKKVVENHNGYIRVESELGKGSKFEIYLPV